MNLEIKWAEPYKIRSNNGYLWKREWLIPVNYRNGFFTFWRKSKFKLLNKGFSVYKKDEDWFLTETKSHYDLFEDFTQSAEPTTKEPTELFWVPPYEVKNKEGLRPWQIDGVSKIVGVLNKINCSVDGSVLGVGKTYTAIGVARELNVPFVVICPKAVMTQWKKVINDHFKLGDKLIGIINYEMLIRGKKESNIASIVENKKLHRKVFTWKLPHNALIIWDEAHKLKNFKTKNSKCCIAALKQNYRQLFLSATVATNPLEIRTIGNCLGLFNGGKQYYEWAKQHGCFQGRWGWEFNNDQRVLKKIHKYVFDERGVRLNRDQIPDFPECEIEVEPYDLDENITSQINEVYSIMKKELKIIENKIKNDGESELTIILRAREKVEILKLPLIVEMINEGIEQGMSVVVFLNFTNSIQSLSKILNTKCIFDGKIPDNIRQKNVDDFIADKERVIIINVAAGGAGLSIGDINGKYPRLALISPSYSAIAMRQVTGRIWRENSKTKSIQRIIFASGTIEQEVVHAVRTKMKNIDTINDDDLMIK